MADLRDAMLGREDVNVSENKYAAMLKSRTEYSKAVRQIEEETNRKIRESGIKNAEELSRFRKRLEQENARIYERIWKSAYKNGSALQKAEMKKQEADRLKEERELADQLMAVQIAAQTDPKVVQRLTNERNKQRAAEIRAEYAARDQANKLRMSQEYRYLKQAKKQLDSIDPADAFKNKSVAVIAALSNVGRVGMKDLATSIRKDAEESAKIVQDLQREMDELASRAGDHAEEIAALEEQLKTARTQATKDAIKNSLVSVATTGYDQVYKEAETILTTYKSRIDARLQGSGKSYNASSDLISTNLSLSPFVQTQKVLDSFRRFTDEGIAYNVEQRAFLSTISEKIATTFDAFDSNLTRLIKLQQADSTAARLGMEASLTRWFNSTFQDTSYLTNLSKQVSAALLDASSQLDRNTSTEFEYTVQKWLGSLSALGMSDAAILSIAQGINMLGTGDVQGLSSNSQLQTLLAMSSSKAGLNYADLLLKGMNSENTNRLLESMVQYLKEIAENSDNQVVKAAYGGIFNMSLSDFKSISNLSQSDIANIANTNLTYGGMQKELNSQFNQVILRTSLSEMMSNLYNNAVFGVAEDLVSNPATFAMKKMLDFMEGNSIDINIPFIDVMGTGIDLNTSVNGLLRLGLGLSSAMSLMGNILGGLSSGGGLNLDSWNATEYTQRGASLSTILGSMQGEKSSSTYVGTSNVSTMKSSALSSATDEAEETGKITNKNKKTEHTFDDFYGLFEKDFGTTTLVADDGRIQTISALEPNQEITIKGVRAEEDALLVKVKGNSNIQTQVADAIRSALGMDNNPYSNQMSMQQILQSIFDNGVFVKTKPASPISVTNSSMMPIGSVGGTIMR